ncbi:MAG: hypothetical protein ACI4NM_10350 [Bullifex sp.]
MTQKESALILSATDNLFNRLEVPVLYVQVQAYRRILSSEAGKDVSFREALQCYGNDVFTHVINAIDNNRVLRKTARKQGLSYLYLLITEELSDAKNITREEYLSLVDKKIKNLREAA